MANTRLLKASPVIFDWGTCTNNILTALVRLNIIHKCSFYILKIGILKSAAINTWPIDAKQYNPRGRKVSPLIQEAEKFT